MTRSSLVFPVTRRDFVVGIGATAALSLAPPAFAQPATPRRGGTLVMAIWPDLPSMVGAFTSSDPQTITPPKVSEGLCSYDYQFQLQPRLATSWAFAPDGLSVRFNLRPGVTWHDGQDFTSADVAFSILELLKKYHPRGRSVYANVDAVDTPDAHTAILRLSKPSPMIVSSLAGYESPILPRHIYAGSDPLTNPANMAPIGTGPFVFKEWHKGSDILLERNPNYWDPGKPYLDRIILKVINDASARVASLEAGEVMIAGPNPVPPSEIARFKQNENFVVEIKGEELLNHGSAIQVNLRNPALAKPEVRQAIYHAINRDVLARIVWYGTATAAISPIQHQAADLQAKDVLRYPFDVAKANALLDQAGLKRAADGTRLTLKLDWIPIGDANLRTAEVVKQQLKSVGINAEIRSSDLPTYLKRIYTDYDFDLNIFLYTPTRDPSIGLQRFYWSKAQLKGTPFVNASGYASPAMDQILEAASIEPDMAKRKELLYQFQRLAMTDLPVLPLLDLDYTAIHAKKVQNLVASPEGIRGNFADLWLSA
jgi:peptide/nickel transport system substrate-binding protein